MNIADLEVALQTRSENILVYLGLENEGNPGLTDLQALVYVDADAEPGVLQEVLDETVRRSPVLQTLQRAVAVKTQVRKT